MMLCTLYPFVCTVYAECPVWMLTHNATVPVHTLILTIFFFTSSLSSFSFTPAYRCCLTVMLTATSYVRFSTHTQSAGVFWHMAIPAKSNLTHLSSSVSTFRLQGWEKRAVTTCMHCRPPDTALRWNRPELSHCILFSSTASGFIPPPTSDSLCSTNIYIYYKYFIPKD